MKKIIQFTILYLLPLFMLGQVGVGTTAPNEYTILEAQSTEKGFLIPRVSISDRNDNLEDNDPGTTMYNSPCGGAGEPPCETQGTTLNNSTLPIGTLIFNTDDGGYEFWNGTTWTKITGSALGVPASSLPEIGAVDAEFGGTPWSSFWGLSNYVGSNDEIAGPIPYDNINQNPSFQTDRVIIGFSNEVDISGNYGLDNRSADLRASNLFEFKPNPSITPSLNTVFWPESPEATYDFQFTFDMDKSSGGNGDEVVISAWFASDLVQVSPGDYDVLITTISMTPNQLVRANNEGGNFTGDPAGSVLGRPFLQFVKVIPNGNNESYDGFSLTLRVLSSSDAFNNGVSFTIQSPKADITINNMKCLVTRVR